VTPEQRIQKRFAAEFGCWPAADNVQQCERAGEIIHEELEFAYESGEIPQMGDSQRRYRARVYFYGGHLQVVFSGVTAAVLPKKRRRFVESVIRALTSREFIFLLVVQTLALLTITIARWKH
jgi:energy-converting hydrogenase Eha subunit E